MSRILTERKERPFRLRRVVLTLSLTLVAGAALLLVIGSTSDVQGRVLQSGSATVYVDPVEQSVSRYDSFAVALKIRDLPRNLVGYEFTLNFNPDVVTVTNVVDVRFNGGTFPSDPDIGADRVRFLAFTMGQGEDVDGTLAVVEMQAVGVGRSDLVLTRLRLSDGDGETIAATVEDGAVETMRRVLLPIAIKGGG